MNGSRYDEACSLMMLLLDDLPSDVTGLLQLKFETIGMRAKEVNRLGEWDDVGSLARAVGDSVILRRDDDRDPVSSLQKLFDEGFDKGVEVDVGEYRFTRDLSMAEENMYSITKNPRYSDYKRQLIRLYRLGAPEGTANN